MHGTRVAIRPRNEGSLTHVTACAHACGMCVPAHACVCVWLGGRLLLCMWTCVHMCLHAVCLCMREYEFDTHVPVCVLWVCGSGRMCACGNMCSSCVFMCTCAGVYCAHTCGDMHVCVHGHVHTGTVPVMLVCTPACVHTRLCRCVCMDVCLCCTCVHMCIRRCACMHMGVSVCCMCVSVCMWVVACVVVCFVCVHVCGGVCMYVHVCGLCVRVWMCVVGCCVC